MFAFYVCALSDKFLFSTMAELADKAVNLEEVELPVVGGGPGGAGNLGCGNLVGADPNQQQQLLLHQQQHQHQQQLPLQQQQLFQQQQHQAQVIVQQLGGGGGLIGGTVSDGPSQNLVQLPIFAQGGQGGHTAGHWPCFECFPAHEDCITADG